MNFEEHAAKSLVLAPAGIAIPRGVLCASAAEAGQAAATIGPCVVKAQVPTGKRGKAGGIKLANSPAETEKAAGQIIGMTIGDYKVERLLIEEQAKIAREFYAAVLHDTTRRKPLILFTPKSLLRHKRAVSGLVELGPDSCFHRLLWDDAEAPGLPKTTTKLVADEKIRRVVLCTGKVYYDLLEDREKKGIDDVYLLRVEQLYPFPAKALLDELNRFPNAEVVWCQEEPRNMGAWAFIQPYVEWVLDQMGRGNQRVRYVGRPAAASPASAWTCS